MTVRILLADDHTIVRRGLRALLETRGDFSVCAEAANGREAVELAVLHAPDVVILDISLPLLNGVDATSQIRKSVPGAQILIFTMHDSPTIIQDVLHAGARGYLLKSEGNEEVIAAVDALSRRRTYFSSQVSEAMLDVILQDGHLKRQSDSLSSREREIVQLISEGQSNKQIAAALQISVKTVETHRSTSMRKLKVHSTAELVRYALRNKLIQP